MSRPHQTHQHGTRRTIRSIRVDDDTWTRAQAVAAEMGTTVSLLVVEYLQSLGKLGGIVQPAKPKPEKVPYDLTLRPGDPGFVPKGKRRGIGKAPGAPNVCDGSHVNTKQIGTYGRVCVLCGTFVEKGPAKL